LLQEILPNLKALHVEDRLFFCHVCHVGKEATTKQVAQFLCRRGLKQLKIDSDHAAFNDELLETVAPGLTGTLRHLSLNGSNFTDDGILDHIIPHLQDDLVEFSAGYGGINPVSLTGCSVLALLENCPNLKRLSLEGLHLNDSDFTDFMGDDLPESTLEYLWLGKTCHQDFTVQGLRSLLMTCHKSLISLVLDLDHMSQTVLQDVIIPLFQMQRLQELHLVSEAWAEWAAHYPRPRYEHEMRAKDAMWRWKLKAYWGISKDLIKLVGVKVKTLKVFSILGENHLEKTFTYF